MDQNIEGYLDKVLVVSLSHVHFLFPGTVVTYDNGINVLRFVIIGYYHYQLKYIYIIFYIIIR